MDFDAASDARAAVSTRDTEIFALHDLKPSFSFVANEQGDMTPVMLLTGRM
jgi:hypothetical protein